MGNLQKQMIRKKNNGITLIALVITIIVLLILAGVTIATLTGENGILTRASDASEETKKASVEEQVKLAVAASIGEDGKINLDDLNTELGKIEGEKTGIPVSSLPADITIDGYEVHIDGNGSVSVGDNSGGGNSGTGETVVEGVKIPEGFYHVEGTTVTGGLVISDVKGDDLNNSKGGNQYVWIPVDGILGEDGTIDDVTGNEKKILLGRYSFNSSGVPAEYSGSYTEEDSRDTESLLNYGNAIANDIKGFIDSVRENGGYYIARFEASQGSNDKAESKYNKTVWTDIIQPNAAKACQKLYTEVNSDLMNNYAWDTAILFVQKYGQSNYSMQDGNSINSSKQTTGLSGDMQLNIYDMAGNCMEWTTETANRNMPCIYMGGNYSSSDRCTADTFSYGTGNSSNNISFRTILYL